MRRPTRCFLRTVRAHSRAKRGIRRLRHDRPFGWLRHGALTPLSSSRASPRSGATRAGAFATLGGSRVVNVRFRGGDFSVSRGPCGGRSPLAVAASTLMPIMTLSSRGSITRGRVSGPRLVLGADAPVSPARVGAIWATSFYDS